MVLDNLAQQYSGQVAVITIYTSGGSPPFYNATAYQKIYTYPPPYWYNNNWYFATPWLWVDGNKSAAYLTSTWNSYISQRMQISSDLDIYISKDGNEGLNDLNMNIVIANNGSSSISGKLHCVLTENGLQWTAPNGQQIHNHVPRIWWPDQNGMSVTITSGNEITIPVGWDFQPTWSVDSLWVVAFLQSNIMQPDSSIEIYQGATAKVQDIPTAIENDGNKIVQNFQLRQNYPNPFNPITTINYHLPKSSEVELAVYNLLGQKIRLLVNSRQPAGSYEIEWDGVDGWGNEAASGVYIYRLKTQDRILSKKMILLK